MIIISSGVAGGGGAKGAFPPPFFWNSRYNLLISMLSHRMQMPQVVIEVVQANS